MGFVVSNLYSNDCNPSVIIMDGYKFSTSASRSIQSFGKTVVSKRLTSIPLFCMKDGASFIVS